MFEFFDFLQGKTSATGSGAEEANAPKEETPFDLDKICNDALARINKHIEAFAERQKRALRSGSYAMPFISAGQGITLISNTAHLTDSTSPNFTDNFIYSAHIPDASLFGVAVYSEKLPRWIPKRYVKLNQV